MKMNVFHVFCLSSKRRWKNRHQWRSGSKPKGQAFLAHPLFLWWGLDFNGLVQPFMLLLAEFGSHIGNHLFFFTFFNYRWHNLLDDLIPLSLICSKHLVRLCHDLLSLRTNCSLLLRWPGDRNWGYRGSWTRGLARSPFLTFFSLEHPNEFVLPWRQRDERPCRRASSSVQSVRTTRDSVVLALEEEGLQTAWLEK